MRRFIAWKQAVINRIIKRPWIVGVSQTLAPPFSPADMFTPTTPGWVYDLSDFSTLFQDSAGTTPVTAVEQPVGLIIDKSPQGNHASQATTTKRPVLSSRVNLLTYSEDFTNAAWGASRATISGNTATAPDGTLTADSLTTATGTTAGEQFVRVTRSDTGMVNASFYIKKNNWRYITLRNVNYSIYDFDTNSFTLVGAGETPLAEDAGGGWVRISSAAVAAGVHNSGLGLAPSGTTVSWSVPVDGSSVYIWGAQLNYGPTAQPYQWITTATNYDTVGFPLYLKGDGVDDFLSTAAIDFTGADSVTIWQGVQKLSDTESGVLCELGAESITLNGTFGLFAPEPSGTGYMFNSRGTSRAFVISPSHPAPHKCVLTAQGRISTDTCAIQINEGVVMTNAADQGINAYTDNPLYFGARGGTSNFFGGEQYSSVGIGKLVTPEELYQTRNWVNDRTGAY